MKITEQECWTYLKADGSSHNASRFQFKRERMEITGKYLFFSRVRKLLLLLAENEIENHGFAIAKVSKEPSRTGDYVLCLYWKDDSRKVELTNRYSQGIVKYRWWKSDADTVAGKYSKLHTGEKE